MTNVIVVLIDEFKFNDNLEFKEKPLPECYAMLRVKDAEEEEP